MGDGRQGGNGAMSLAWIGAGMLALAAVLAAVMEPVTHAELAATTSLIGQASPALSGGQAAAHLLYGRVTTDQAVFEGRLRWGGDQEALWINYFNGAKSRNPWSAYAPGERRSLTLFGLDIAGWTSQADVGRPFMARFGDIRRVDRYGREWRITLKSGAVVHIAWGGADDMNDGLRVWDGTRGVVTLAESPIRTIEFLAAPPREDSALPLYGRVRTRQGDFTGFLQWNRTECLGTDTLDGRTADGVRRVRFDTIRSIARHSPASALVTLVDGRSLVLSGSREVGGQDYGGIYVDDQRYGRVLVSWDAFERVDFRDGGASPAYVDYAPGRPLAGTVTTRDGRRLAGRLVYDLDESETTETLDAPAGGIDYTLPFSLVASIVAPTPEGSGAQRVMVILRGGEVLQLEQGGDLSWRNAGMLVFGEGRERPEYVRWADVKLVEFDR
jgi:hypothetical protein